MVANLAPSLPAWFCESVALGLHDDRRGRGRTGNTPAPAAPADSVQRWLEGRLDPNNKQLLDQATALAWKKQRPMLKSILEELQAGKPLEAVLKTRSGGTVTDFVAALLQ
jgi:hypothetical protein